MLLNRPKNSSKLVARYAVTKFLWRVRISWREEWYVKYRHLVVAIASHATYPECRECIGAHFEIALINPFKELPEDTVAFLGQVGFQVR